MANARNERTLRGRGEPLEHRVAIRAPGTAHFYLDQFMIVQRAGGFRDDTAGDTVAANQNDGIQGMREAPQVLALLFGQFHRAIVGQEAPGASVRALKPGVIAPMVVWRETTGWCSVEALI